jgi:alpha-L-fucosidase
MVITAKHHDGFALFPSAVSEWDISDATPYGKDLIGPLADAARKEGLKFGLYYSQAQDWVHPGGAKSRFEEPQGWDPAQVGTMESYLDTIAVPQVREILTRYRPDILWWDTPRWMNQERANRLIPLIGLVPGIIHNDRLGGDYQGDTETPEQHIPATGFPDRDWEVCMTMNDTWGYKSYDENWKSTETLIQKLCDIVSKGGNFLLNIGPKADGTIPQASIDRLEEVGAWMAVNGESIYGTTASPFGRFPWGRSTVKFRDDGATVYLHVFDWPADGKLRVPGFGSEPESIRLLATGERLNFDRFAPGDDKGISVHVPAGAPDPHASVIRIEVSGGSDFEEILPGQLPDGRLMLTPGMAELHSSYSGRLALETISGKENIKNWDAHSAWVGWRFRVTKPGVFTLQSEVAAEEDSKLTAQLNDEAKIDVAIARTGQEKTFVPMKLGTLKVETPGVYELQIRPAGRDTWNPIRLRAVEMVPENKPASGIP